MKITDYSQTETLNSSDVLLIDGINGTKTIRAGKAAGELDKLSESSAVEKTTPVNADTLPVFDSAASFVRKKITWANLINKIGSALTNTFAAKSHSHNTSDIGAVPTTRKINTKPLSSDITLSASDVGALPSNGNAASASKLSGSYTIRVNLESENPQVFNGTSSITPGVHGILSPLHGGIGDAPEMHRMIFRGKNLGSALTSTQKNAIQNGTFDDLYLGDYWNIGEVNWRIVDFDYWLNIGDTPFLNHHLVIMPDTALAVNSFNEEAANDGGYANCDLRKIYFEDDGVLSKIHSAFGDNLLTHREYFSSEVVNDRITQCSWSDSTVEIPNQFMIYGHYLFVPTYDCTMLPSLDNIQLALFAVKPNFIHCLGGFWMRDIVSQTKVVVKLPTGVNGGRVGLVNASRVYNYYPVFPIGVA